MTTSLVHPCSARISLSTGVTLHYMEQGAADGNVIVFVHGWPDSWYSFSRVLSLLPRHYRAFAVDLRGFGRSDRPQDGYRIDNHAADVAAFLEATGTVRATLVGHSMGTFVARRVAQTFPERVSSLVLIGSAASPWNPVTRQIHDEIAELPDPVPVQFARDFQGSTVHERLPEPFFDGLVAESAALPAHIWRRTFDGLLGYDDTAKIGRISAPTLLLWGQHDGLFGRDQQDQLLRRINGARLIVYPDAGHSPNWERPDRVVQDVHAFITAEER